MKAILFGGLAHGRIVEIKEIKDRLFVPVRVIHRKGVPSHDLPNEFWSCFKTETYYPQTIVTEKRKYIIHTVEGKLIDDFVQWALEQLTKPK